MARDCWCGCGRVLGRSDSRIAKRAFEAETHVAALRERHLPILVASDTDTSEFEEFIGYGEHLVGELLMVAHGELPADAVDRRGMNRWGKYAVRILRDSGPSGYALVRSYSPHDR
jgi:hypothetical protein